MPSLQSRIIDSNEPTLYYVGKSTSCTQSANIRAITNKNIQKSLARSYTYSRPGRNLHSKSAIGRVVEIRNYVTINIKYELEKRSYCSLVDDLGFLIYLYRINTRLASLPA